MQDQPLVSVVTPVFNGAKYLRECIDSVLQQTYPNFEHVILDNASTDQTGRIAADYSARDPRIRVVRNEATLWVVDNWNRALEMIAPDSRYCRVLHADDTMYPQYLEKTVALGLRHPEVGIVGSLRLRGDKIECGGLPPDRESFNGHAVARLFLTRDVFAFAPTSTLLRSDLVRARRPFYPRRYLHADLAAYFELLARHDFGFVDEVLCFSRTHADSITSTVAQRKQTILHDWLLMLQQHGPLFFTPAELSKLERKFLRGYYRVLVRGFVTRRGKDFFNYHLDGLRQANRLPHFLDWLVATAAELGESIVDPRKPFRHLRARFRH